MDYQGQVTLPCNNPKHIVISKFWSALGFSLINAGSSHMGLYVLNLITHYLILASDLGNEFEFCHALKDNLLVTDDYDLLCVFWLEVSSNFLEN